MQAVMRKRLTKYIQDYLLNKNYSYYTVILYLKNCYLFIPEIQNQLLLKEVRCRGNLLLEQSFAFSSNYVVPEIYFVTRKEELEQ